MPLVIMERGPASVEGDEWGRGMKIACLATVDMSPRYLELPQTTDLVEPLCNWAVGEGIEAFRAVPEADNEAVPRLYDRSDFAEERRTKVHDRQPSLEMHWSP